MMRVLTLAAAAVFVGPPPVAGQPPEWRAGASLIPALEESIRLLPGAEIGFVRWNTESCTPMASLTNLTCTPRCLLSAGASRSRGGLQRLDPGGPARQKPAGEQFDAAGVALFGTVLAATAQRPEPPTPVHRNFLTSDCRTDIPVSC